MHLHDAMFGQPQMAKLLLAEKEVHLRHHGHHDEILHGCRVVVVHVHPLGAMFVAEALHGVRLRHQAAILL